ncbi:MAG: pyruvate dehydrogenase E1 component beta subunit [Myxococcota bacterium]
MRSLRPLDEEALYGSVAKTGRCVVVHEGHLYSGIGSEIAARVQEACFDWLKAPILRVTNREVPQPYATNLEKLVVPNPQRIVDAVNRVLGR